MLSKMRDLDEYCEVFSIQDWIENCRMNLLTEDDGSGYYATDTQVSDFYASPSALGLDKPSWATHVAWYNK